MHADLLKYCSLGAQRPGLPWTAIRKLLVSTAMFHPYGMTLPGPVQVRMGGKQEP
jgi:hypothetical protein